jgi:putative glutamine amidotransferase
MANLFIGISTPNTRIEDALQKLGATPILFDEFSLKSLDQLNGTVIPGNEYDVPPHFYGQETHPKTLIPDDNTRLDFERELINHAFIHFIPLLAICGGAQLLNVAFNGTITQNIPDIAGSSIEHRQAIGTFHVPTHKISILEETRLRSIGNADAAEVNSNHHQAIHKTGKGFIVNAVAPDGTIEGIEHTVHPFLLGVQWHPEFHASIIDNRIFAAFVDAAATRKKANKLF